LRTWFFGIAAVLVLTGLASADVVINVLVINGAAEKRETPIRFVLPPDLKAQDVVDADGLSMEYDVNEGAYVAQGTAELDPKASKTFRIKVHDVWKVTDQDVEAIQKEVQEAYDKLGNVGDQNNTELLKRQLLDRLEFVVVQHNANTDSIERRIDSFRIYRSRLEEIKRDALSVDYWRSNPQETAQKLKTVRMVVEVENPASQPKRKIEEKYYLPTEIKPEYVINREDFEIKFDEERQKPYLFKEEEFEPGQKRRYEIGIKDVWFVVQKDVDYLNKRSTYALNFLKESQYEKTAQYLFDRCQQKLNSITASQEIQRQILEHISAFRLNTKTFNDARKDVEDLEKLVSIYREELEKTKVKNVLQKIRSLNSISQVSDSIFNKKPKMNKTWEMIGWVLLFVGGYTIVHFLVWLVRSAGTRKKEDEKTPEQKK